MRRAYKLGLHSIVRQLIVLQNKLKIIYNPALSIQEINKKITDTFKQRKVIKQISESLSLEYGTRLALAKEEAGEVEAATYIRSLQQIERQRRLFQNIRLVENKVKGGSTCKVTITSPSHITL